MRLRLAPIALLSVAAMWGAAFVLMKDAIKREDVNSFLFTRFAVAAVVMIVLKPKVSKYFSPDLLVKGFIAGSFLGSGYILQTLGLARTTAAVTGFVTGMYVIATPLIAALVLHQRISRRTWVYVLIATLGLALLSLHGWSVGSGELLVLCSSIAFACHIIALGQWSSGRDAYAFTVIQLATCALLAGRLGSRNLHGNFCHGDSLHNPNLVSGPYVLNQSCSDLDHGSRLCRHLRRNIWGRATYTANCSWWRIGRDRDVHDRLAGSMR
jgi:drug/metabolite transporter (DMT)-like permease